MHGALSDLFFNHEHDRRAELFHQKAATKCDPPSHDEQLACAVLEAQEFLDLIRPLEIIAADGVTARELADDFLGRI